MQSGGGPEAAPPTNACTGGIDLRDVNSQAQRACDFDLDVVGLAAGVEVVASPTT